MSPSGARLKPSSPKTLALTLAALTALGGATAFLAAQRSLLEVAWPDECIYLVGARKLSETGSLDTNFYLTYSLLRRGYPHRDVHMPGYVFALTPFVAALGDGLRAGATLNVALYLASILLVHRIARRLLDDPWRAATAALFFAVAPPTAGYLFVVYPEIVVSFVFLCGLAWLVSSQPRARDAAVAGALLGLGALFRETLLVALPLYLVAFPRRLLLRAFAPALILTLLGVSLFARDRAVHPNAIYPSVIEEARASDMPLATLTAALTRNVRRNLELIADADPLANAEDAVLLFVFVAAAAALAARRRLRPIGRRLLGATLVSLALLTAAVLVLYVVRVQGGVWGGVRAYMAWLPLLFVFAAGGLPNRPARAAVAAALALCLGVGLSAWQLKFFARYKRTDLEDQARNAEYLWRHLERHAPHRIVSRSFLYGWRHYPVEVVWSLPRDYKELVALEQAIDYDFISIHWKSRIRLFLIRNPRYVRENKDDRDAEFLIFRRVY